MTVVYRECKEKSSVDEHKTTPAQSTISQQETMLSPQCAEANADTHVHVEGNAE